MSKNFTFSVLIRLFFLLVYLTGGFGLAAFDSIKHEPIDIYTPGLPFRIGALASAQNFLQTASLHLHKPENLLSSAVIDPDGKFAYFGAYTDPGVIVKVRMSNLSRVGALILNSGEYALTSAVIDPAGEYAYFGNSFGPGKVIKVRLSDFTRVGALDLNPPKARPGAGFRKRGFHCDRVIRVRAHRRLHVVRDEDATGASTSRPRILCYV